MTTTIAPEIAAFAAAVRAELADLPPEELDDLVDGLEADLAERLEESPDAGLGDPVAYAAELRAAAGYPARSSRRTLDLDAAFLARWRELRADWTAFAERHRVVRGTVDLVVSLRPAWWVYRGWALFALIASSLFGIAAFPDRFFSWVLLIAAVVLSVQVGRRMWLRHRIARGAVVVVDVLLVLMTPAIIGWAVNSVQNPAIGYEEPWYSGQLAIDGRPIDNIFAYDEFGEPIERVQLFDQDGNPLNLVSDTSQSYWIGGDGTAVVPNEDVPGRAGWNVYPLDEVDGADASAFAGDLVEPRSAKPPFATVKPLADAEKPEPESGGPVAGEDAP